MQGRKKLFFVARPLRPYPPPLELIGQILFGFFFRASKKLSFLSFINLFTLHLRCLCTVCACFQSKYFYYFSWIHVIFYIYTIKCVFQVEKVFINTWTMHSILHSFQKYIHSFHWEFKWQRGLTSVHLQQSPSRHLGLQYSSLIEI